MARRFTRSEIEEGIEKWENQKEQERARRAAIAAAKKIFDTPLDVWCSWCAQGRHHGCDGRAGASREGRQWVCLCARGKHFKLQPPTRPLSAVIRP